MFDPLRLHLENLTQHFYLYPISQNFVTWPYLAAREIRKRLHSGQPCAQLQPGPLLGGKKGKTDIGALCHKKLKKQEGAWAPFLERHSFSCLSREKY